MKLIDKILSSIIPPYAQMVSRRGQAKLILKIIDSLPDKFSELKSQSSTWRHFSLTDWKLFPDFKFTSMSFPFETLRTFKKRNENFKIEGIEILSKKTNNKEFIEILFHHNILTGLKISNSTYSLDEFDLSTIRSVNALKSDFAFPPDDIEIFYNSLSSELKNQLDVDQFEEIEFNNGIYFSFHDMENGNYIAVDKKANVYSLVHDAQPAVKKINKTFANIVSEIKLGQFDFDKHFDERYRDARLSAPQNL